MLRLLGALIALGLSSVSSKDISYCSECTSIRPSRGKYMYPVLMAGILCPLLGPQGRAHRKTQHDQHAQQLLDELSPCKIA